MNNFEFTTDKILSYFKTYFKDDLNRYYEALPSKKECDEIINSYKFKKINFKEENTEFIFSAIAFVVMGFHNTVEDIIKNQETSKKLIDDCGLPYLPPQKKVEGIYRVNEEYDRLLNCYGMKPRGRSDKELTLKSLEVAVPCIKDELINRLNNCDLDNETKRLICKRFIKSMESAEFDYVSSLVNQTGLLDMDFSTYAFNEYFPKYFNQFGKYFKTEQLHEGVWGTMEIYAKKANRFVDGHPGDNTTENFMFSCVFLMMVIIEQCMLERGHKVYDSFLKGMNWPMICSGLGAAQYLNPLRMLLLSGLAPSSEEAPLYVKMLKVVRESMYKYTEMIKKGGWEGNADEMRKFNDMVDDDTFQSIMEKIKKVTNMYTNLIEKKWKGNDAKSISELLEAENLPILMPIPED